MFGTMDTTGQHYDHCGHYYSNYDPQMINNCQQSNYLSTLLNDLTDLDYNYYNPNMMDPFADSSETSSPPPTPDIITTFATIMPQESPMTNITTPPQYQNLSSPPRYSHQSPSSVSLASPSSACTSLSSMSVASPPTIEQTKTQLIKEGLRVSIQSRRMAKGIDDISANDLSPMGIQEFGDSNDHLTYEDESKRKRRRERNKVAATKCRNKKKAHSVYLHEESDALEISNASLRKEISDLSQEYEKLKTLLQSHQQQCHVNELQLQTQSKINCNNQTHNSHYGYNNININDNYVL